MQLKVPPPAARPWGSVTAPGGSAGCLRPPSPGGAGGERAREAAAQDCGSSINRSGCTSSLVTFRLLTDAQLPASLRYRKFLPVHPDSQRQETRFVGRDGQLEPRERRFPPKSRREKKRRGAFFRDNITCDVFAYRILISAALL